jgi:hypothetical protein
MPTATRKPPANKSARNVPAPAAPTSDTDDVIALDPDVVEFEVEFTDGDTGETETHTFRARPRYGYKRMRDAALAQKKRGADLVLMFERMITPSLLNDDGTPHGWTPEFSPNGDFIDPDGNTRPVADLDAIVTPDAGSSRRRWAWLMDERDELDPGLDELQRVYNLMIENASGRPTQRPSSS